MTTSSLPPSTIPHSLVNQSIKKSIPTTASNSPDTLVIGTNDFSIVSKRSAERMGYFDQVQHLRHFVSKPRRRAPLINIAYAIRTTFVDLIIQRFLDTHQQSDASDSSIVIVNLGCGYDPGFFKLACSKDNSMPSNLLYVDADYPALIKKKHAMISQTGELSAVLPGFSGTSPGSFVTMSDDRMSYALLGCDLCDTQRFIDSLTRLLGGSQRPILFISEVSTVYMPAEKSDQLLAGLSSTYPRAVYACLEQVVYPSPTGFSDTMFAHFHQLQTPLRGTIRYPTIEDQSRKLRKLWKNVEISTLLGLWNSMDNFPQSAKEKTRLLQVEEFDEWEELDFFLSHYLIAIASHHTDLMAATYENLLKVNLPSMTSRVQSQVEDMAVKIQTTSAYTELTEHNIQRRGHTAGALLNGSQFIFGGFGLPSVPGPEVKLTHSRLSHPMIMIPKSKNPLKFTLKNIPVTPSTPCARMYHTSSCFERNGIESVLIFGGRTSPRAPLNDLHVFELESRNWNSIQPDASALWPEPRYRHAAALINPKGTHQLCLIHGGIGRGGLILSDTWIFDCNLLKWTRASFLDSLIGPRHSHQICYDTSISKLLVLGGLATIVSQPDLPRIAPNIKIGLIIGQDKQLRQLDTSQPLQLPDNAFMCRYAHQVTPWNSNPSVLLIGGGLVASGIIPPEFQCILVDTRSGMLTTLNIAKYEPRCFVDHTITLINVASSDSSSVSNKSVAIIIGGGTTCLSFGSRFDTHGLLLSDAPLPAQQVGQQEDDDTRLYFKSRTPTFSSDSEDTWNHIREIPRKKSPNQVDWDRALIRSEPIVFEKLDLGDCVNHWTPDYLRDNCGELKCSVHVSTSSNLTWHTKNFKYTLMSFQELINRTFGDSAIPSETLYLRSLSASPRQPSDFSRDFPEISKDFKLPEPLCGTVMDHFFSSVLRISGADMGLWAHYDTCDNVLAQVKGRKLVRMWHPSEAPNLYLEGSSSHMPNFEQPDLEKYPLYRKSHMISAILEPGDVLFIPATWLHSVQSLEPSISINTFFRSQPSSLYSTRDVWGNVDPLPVQSVQTEMMKLIQKLDLLPITQRQFYIKKLGMDLIRFADQE
ncbi:hypothetical protein DFH28DRAFT_921540 [Melampsora americana]|nr:hypothetical protein DFH28DRAFT_921540 [Melampsora americana]